MQSDKATTKARKPTTITKRILCTKPFFAFFVELRVFVVKDTLNCER